MSKASHVEGLIPIRAKHTVGINLLLISYHDSGKPEYICPVLHVANSPLPPTL